MYPEPGSPNGFCGKFVKLNQNLQSISNQYNTKPKFEKLFFGVSLIFVNVVQEICNLHHRYYLCSQN